MLNNNYFLSIEIPNSFNCFSSTSLGHSHIKSDAEVVLGNAITSLMFSVFASNITILSRPGAAPACGGAPYLNASYNDGNFDFKIGFDFN